MHRQKHTPETKAKMSTSHKKSWEGRELSPKQLAHLKDMQAARVGTRHSVEARARMGVSKTGQKYGPPSAEHRANLAAAHQGVPLSPEHCAAIGVASTGRKQSPETCAKKRAAMLGNKNAEGHKHSPETKAKMRAARLGKKHGPVSEEQKARLRAINSGPNHPQWRGGISNEPYAWTFNAELKEEVRRRDGYRCQLCGAPQAECKRALTAHHVDYDKKNSDPVNLVALCNACNARVNFNRERWTAFFRAMAIERKLR